jgi:hypothetical protein
MQGQILQVNDRRRAGLILGGDGKRYDFLAADWRGANPPMIGMPVDYVTANTAAREVFPLHARADVGAYASPRTDNSVVLGWLGIGCLVLSFVIPILPTIGAFVLGLIGANAAKRAGNGQGLVLSRIAWIGAVLQVMTVLVLLALGLSFLGLVVGFSFNELLNGNWGEIHRTLAGTMLKV